MLHMIVSTHNQAPLAAGLVGRTHSRMLPVVALEDAMNIDDDQREER